MEISDFRLDKAFSYASFLSHIPAISSHVYHKQCVHVYLLPFLSLLLATTRVHKILLASTTDNSFRTLRNQIFWFLLSPNNLCVLNVPQGLSTACAMRPCDATMPVQIHMCDRSHTIRLLNASFTFSASILAIYATTLWCAMHYTILGCVWSWIQYTSFSLWGARESTWKKLLTYRSCSHLTFLISSSKKICISLVFDYVQCVFLVN